ncbi:MAG: Fic family protein [Fluviicola sp.]|nr:Fic family protein [Fluviicola sp.]
MSIKHFSLQLSVFHGRKVPDEGVIVGYGAIIEAYKLPVPIPQQLAFVSTKKRQSETEEWKVFPSRYLPEENLYKQLIFAFKYEGVNLLVFKKLFEVLETKELENMLQQESLGQYSRRIWFLYEWLTGSILNLPDLKTGNLVPLLDEKIQYAVKGASSPRHKVINNLPGTPQFCPLIRKTEKLESYIQSDIRKQKSTYLDRVHKDVLQRASAYLLLKDSKASFTIEGEKPRSNRAARWGNAIGQAGINPLSIDELNRLQQLVIENDRFTTMGIRKQQGFVGDRERESGEPIPDHISARFEDLDSLMEGLISTKEILVNSEIDPVLAAAKIAFGFVFIHPYVDGNGRLHRYIIHHVLAKMNYSEQGMIFPVSASILSHIKDYNKTLESYSHPVLSHIEWEPSTNNNVVVLNETIDYYRYYDATKQAEFLYDCVHDTLVNIIPNEVDYLRKYDEFKRYVEDTYEMPDDLISLLVRFLEQGNGKLSKRALKKEFIALTELESSDLEMNFNEIFELEE